MDDQVKKIWREMVLQDDQFIYINEIGHTLENYINRVKSNFMSYPSNILK